MRNLPITVPLFLLVFTLYINTQVPAGNENTDRSDVGTVARDSPGVKAYRDNAFSDLKMWTTPSKNKELAVSRASQKQTINFSRKGDTLIDTTTRIQSRVIYKKYEKEIFTIHFSRPAF